MSALLDLYPTRPTSSHIQKAIARANDFSLDEVRSRVAKENPNWSRKRIDTAVAEYRKWLALIVLNKKKFGKLGMCSKDVDEVWHAHILFTRKYAADCKALCGRFIHHQPTPEDKKGDTTTSKNTLAALQSIFGSVHPVWLSSVKGGRLEGNCDDCASISCQPHDCGGGTCGPANCSSNCNWDWIRASFVLEAVRNNFCIKNVWNGHKKIIIIIYTNSSFLTRNNSLQFTIRTIHELDQCRNQLFSPAVLGKVPPFHSNVWLAFGAGAFLSPNVMRIPQDWVAVWKGQKHRFCPLLVHAPQRPICVSLDPSYYIVILLSTSSSLKSISIY